MAQERPITRDDVASAADQFRIAFAGDAGSVVLQLAGSELRLERTSPVEFSVHADDAASRARVILGGDSRPDTYPGGLPYLPGEVVMVSMRDADTLAVWWSRTNPTELLAKIDQQTLDAGWDREPDQPIPDPTIIRHTFGKGDAVRYTTAGQGLVSMIEKSHPPSR